MERRTRLILLAAGLMPLIRQDTGVLLVAVGFWLLVRSRQRWPLALALISWGGGWGLLCTNVLMPLFSDDNAKRFMVENFGQYLSDGNSKGGSSLAVLQRMLNQPLLLFCCFSNWWIPPEGPFATSLATACRFCSYL